MITTPTVSGKPGQAPMGLSCDLFEGLAGRHNGVFGGCWCIYFHLDGPERG